jgi:uncharacterized protein YndB with AHSA1/START domain
MRLGWWRGGTLLVATLVIMAGCGSFKPARGSADHRYQASSREKWAGTMTPSPSGEQAFYLTITPDRKLTATWGPNTAWGWVTLQNGRATYIMEPPNYEAPSRSTWTATGARSSWMTPFLRSTHR